jgi:multicomponent Na+:H+ antiporter subunit F
VTVVYWITFGLLSLAALLTAVRLVTGPRTLDRVMAVDVLVVLIVAGVAVDAAASGRGTNIALLVCVALLGFVGSIGVVRLAEGREEHR